MCTIRSFGPKRAVREQCSSSFFSWWDINIFSDGLLICCPIPPGNRSCQGTGMCGDDIAIAARIGVRLGLIVVRYKSVNVEVTPFGCKIPLCAKKTFPGCCDLHRTLRTRPIDDRGRVSYAESRPCSSAPLLHTGNRETHLLYFISIPAPLSGDRQTGSCGSARQVEAHAEESYPTIDGLRSS